MLRNITHGDAGSIGDGGSSKLVVVVQEVELAWLVILL